jgi:rare lipoprotein A
MLRYLPHVVSAGAASPFKKPLAAVSHALLACSLLSACAITPIHDRAAYDRDIGGYPEKAESREAGHVQTGMISYYGGKFHGRKTASGAPFDKNALTAAHRTLPFGTRVKVTNLDNGRSVIVTVNDRGPYAHGRILDLSEAAAREIGLISKGTTKARITVL